jgi:hypothetical protein
LNGFGATRVWRGARAVGLTTVLALATAGLVGFASGAPVGAARGRPALRAATVPTVPSFSHVFTIVLENYKVEDVDITSAPYLMSLRSQGVTLDNMYGVDHASLTNYIAMTSGQAANAATKADCINFSSACIYTSPNDTNIGDQMEAASKTWKAYMEAMPAPCTHPTTAGTDPYLIGYATRHNPFMYYSDVVGPDLTVKPQRCVDHDVPYSAFAGDLANHTVPNYSLIVPSTCDDAHDRGPSCSLPTADNWLSQNVPQILASPEYQNGGALFITFDESDITDTRGCCGDSQGGKIFTLVLSPFVGTPGADTPTAYNHYSLLRTIEDGFGLPCLAHACDPGIQSLGDDVWTAGETATTGYDSTDVRSLYTVSVRLRALPAAAQKQAVVALAFITALSGRPGPSPVSPPPGTTGPLNVTSGWGPGETAALHAVEQYYGLTAAQAQKFAVLVWGFIFAISP